MRISVSPMNRDSQLASTTVSTGGSARARIGTSRIAMPKPVSPRTKLAPNAAPSATAI